MPDRFDQLNPYRSLLLASVRTGMPVGPVVNAVLEDVRTLIRDREACELVSGLDDTAQGGLRAGFAHYVEDRAPGWSDGTILDRLNQLVVVCRLHRLVALYSSDVFFRASLASRFGNPDFAGLQALERIPRGRLNAAFVQGATRTLWLSGTHRPTTVKADSKILAGMDLRDSLDPLDDQTYYFSAARSVPSALRIPVGVSPRKSAIWAGVSRSWDDFTAGVAVLLAHLEATVDEVFQPLPVVATQMSQLGDIAGVFDISFQPPELTADPSVDAGDRELVERWAEFQASLDRRLGGPRLELSTPRRHPPTPLDPRPPRFRPGQPVVSRRGPIAPARHAAAGRRSLRTRPRSRTPRRDRRVTIGPSRTRRPSISRSPNRHRQGHGAPGRAASRPAPVAPPRRHWYRCVADASKLGLLDPGIRHT